MSDAKGPRTVIAGLFKEHPSTQVKDIKMKTFYAS